MGVHRCRRAAVTVACAAFVASAAPAPAATAPAVPRLVGAKFDKPPVTSRTSTLTVQATGARPVSGIVVAFADGLFGESACRAKARKRVSFAVPHVFTNAGPQPMAVRLDDGGCDGGGGALTQPYVVTPTRPGDPPAADPLVAGTPILTLPAVEGQAPAPVPELPAGLPGLPAAPVTVTDPLAPVTDPLAPIVPVVPPLPPVPPLPTDPLPPLPPVPPLPLRAVMAASAGCPGANLQPAALGLPRARRVLLCLVNAARATQGRRPLRANHRLSVAAARFSREMVAKAFFAHVSPTGSTPITRVKAARYFRDGQQAGVGENVGFGEAELGSPLGMIQAWWGSTTHRVNLLDKDWKEVGLGIATGIPGNPASGATYTTDFGVLTR